MKIKVITLGCKVNIYESEYIIDCIKNSDHQLVDCKDIADVYIINSCTVTNNSDIKSRKLVSHCVKENKNAIVVMLGCYSQYRYKELEEIENIKIILGNKDKSKVIDYLDEFLKTNNKIVKIYDMDKEEFEDFYLTNFQNHTRAFVKVQDGCDSYCSYCIIPYVRGSIRSKRIDVVVKEVEELVKNGYNEIVLVGIHTGKYGKDINSNLKELLTNLLKIKNMCRIRISSIEINEVLDILDLMKETDLIVNHLHIPLQSGCDKVLKLMNRKYSCKDYESIIEKIRNIRPNIAITTDLIVGFPNESEENFLNTVKFIEKIGFYSIHAFPYSARRNTPAAIMKNQINFSVKKDRVKKILELSNKLSKKYEEVFLFSNVEVLVDQLDDNYMYGYTSNYIRVKLPLDSSKYNKISVVELIGIEEKFVIGKII